jgi:formate dehydrogenase major subunit
MTNHWIDLKNAKVFLIEGSNCAENHPMAMKWIMKAKEKGAIIIHVDPRYNRTSEVADIFVRIRPGTDIAFLNCIINYILEKELYDKDFVLNQTNALFITNEEFGFENGLFSGYDASKRSYDNSSWGYALNNEGKPLKANSLDDPRCVFSKVKEFFKRYDFNTVTGITGATEEEIKLVADTMVKNKPGTILYALGMTQHTVGVQNIRSFGVLQLLLGNVGKPGSGINALRGEPNVQGSTDMACLFGYLPGYLSPPNHDVADIDTWTKGSGTFRRTFLINLLKAWFGEHATPDNEFCFNLLPKKNGKVNYSLFQIFETALEGKMKFAYFMGQNPLVTSPNLSVVQEGLSNLDMLVVQDLFEIETAAFWEKREGVDPKSIDTEVIFLPAASFLEREGSLTNSGRMVQWRYTGIEPVGQSKPDLLILDLIFKKVRELYAGSTARKDEAIMKITWDYDFDHDSPKGRIAFAEEVLKEINGYNLVTGELLKGIGELKDDGTTSSGNWVYPGVFANDVNNSKRRDNENDPGGLGIYPGFAWSWPGNMHVLYNRASCDTRGRPIDDERAVIWWDELQGKWAGYDTPDVPNVNDGPDTPNGQRPFRMSGEGVGRLLAATYKDPNPDSDLPRDSSSTPADGPLPEFYEPVESPTTNILHPEVGYNPCVKYPRVESKQPIGKSDEFPYVLCTSSIAEHWCAGSVTRNIPWLNEMYPEPIIELSEALAKKLGIGTGDWVKVWSARGEVTVKAYVTPRMQTMLINGKEVEVVWMPYNWGHKGLSRKPSTNYLTIDAGDPNTSIQETKACLVDIERA